MSAPFDEDGLRHLLLCRVILGKSKFVSPSVEQSHPNSEKYNSGINNLSFSSRYIISSGYMNTHVLPVKIVSIRAPTCIRGFLTTPEKLGKSTGPWLLFSILIWELSKILPASHVSVIIKYRKDHKEGKIPRHELIQKFRQIAGDKLPVEVMKKFSKLSNLGHEVADYGAMDGLEYEWDVKCVSEISFHFDEFLAHRSISKWYARRGGGGPSAIIDRKKTPLEFV